MNHFQKSATLALLLVTAASALGAAPSSLGVGDPAPPITVASWVQGDPVSNGPGGIRVVEFWATWCPPCKESIPHLTELAKKYKGQVSFIGVDISENSKTPVPIVKDFVKTMGPKMAYKVAVDDANGTMSKTWMDAAHQEGIPTAFVVNKEGTVVWIGHPMHGLDEALGQLIAGTFDLKKAKMQFAASTQAAQQQADEEAKMAQLTDQVKAAEAQYKAGKKAEALAALDKIQAPNPLLQEEVSIFKFSLWYPDDKPAAKAYAEKLLAGSKDGTAPLLLELGASASMRPGAPEEDKAYGISLAERALKINPSDPLVEYQVALFYAEDKQNAKGIALAKDALKNIDKANPQFRDRLKADIQKSLDNMQAPAPPSGASGTSQATKTPPKQ
jgi:thiol-disulfide isomerase/thioredoxin